MKISLFLNFQQCVPQLFKQSLDFYGTSTDALPAFQLSQRSLFSLRLMFVTRLVISWADTTAEATGKPTVWRT